MAGNGAVTAAIHRGLGDRLVDSVLVGGTHRANTDDELVGPPPRFFFIPAVAEEQAGEVGLAEYHRTFAEVWREFAAWAKGWIEIDRGAGIDAIEEAYRRVFDGASGPSAATVLSWT